jgi:hypothetical protein
VRLRRLLRLHAVYLDDKHTLTGDKGSECMSASCCDQTIDPHRGEVRYRRVLWVVLAINVATFAIEVAATPSLWAQ